MYRFLMSPKWLFGHVLFLVGVIAFTNFGFWQLRRLDERRTTNAVITERMALPPAPVGEVLGGDPDAAAYRRVAARGEYRADDQLLTVPRSRDGQPGHQVLTPLDTGGEVLLLVDRGWIPLVRGEPDEDLAPPPTGEVSVSGILMPPEPGEVGQASMVARIDPAEIAQRVGAPLAQPYLLLQEQQPAPAELPRPGSPPALDEGDHLSYAVQWFLFAGIALIGYPILVRHTARDRTSPDTESAASPDDHPVGAPG